MEKRLQAKKTLPRRNESPKGKEKKSYDPLARKRRRLPHLERGEVKSVKIEPSLGNAFTGSHREKEGGED